MTEAERGLTRKEMLAAAGLGAAGVYFAGGRALAAGPASALHADSSVTLNWLTWFDHYFPQQLKTTQKQTGIACRTKLAPSDSEIYTTIRQTGSQFDIAAMDALWVPKLHRDGYTDSFDWSEMPNASKQLYSDARNIKYWKDGSKTMAFPNGWATVNIYYNPKYV